MLNSTSRLRTLILTQGAEAPRVRLEGIVTFRDKRSGLTYLQDDAGGIELRGIPAGAGVERGKRIRVTGRFDDSRRIPGVIVDPDGVEILGKGVLPKPERFDADAALTGHLDGRRMLIEAALVQIEYSREKGNALWLKLGLRTKIGFFTALVPWDEAKAIPSHLQFSKVAVTCTGEAIFNNRGQRVGVLFLIPSMDELTVIEPPAADPFARPTRKLSELMRSGLNDDLERIRIEGVALYQVEDGERPLYLRTNEGALEVLLAEGSVEPGDRLAVVGYPELLEKTVVVRDAVVLRLSSGPTPKPLVRGVEELLREGHDSELVRIRGSVLRNALETPRGGLFIEAGDRVVEVMLSGRFEHPERKDLADKLRVGTELAVTGICDLHGAMSVSGSVELTDIRIMARTARDIEVLRPAPWWTTARLLGLAGVLAALSLLTVAWVVALRRRVHAQTEIIRDKIERETRWVERSRIARDIHDDVGSALTQISLLGDLGRRDLVVDPAIERQFERISGQARDAVRALDEIVWTVNPRNDTLAGTVAYLNQMIEDLAEDAGLRCRFDIPEEVPEMPLNARVRHDLLLAAKEAAHNAVKHAGTTLLKVSMHWEDGSLTVEVSDDGSGFDPGKVAAGRTGLDSMRRRMEEVGGEVDFVFGDSGGTSVIFRIPLDLSATVLRPGLPHT